VLRSQARKKCLQFLELDFFFVMETPYWIRKQAAILNANRKNREERDSALLKVARAESENVELKSENVALKNENVALQKQLQDFKRMHLSTVPGAWSGEEYLVQIRDLRMHTEENTKLRAPKDGPDSYTNDYVAMKLSELFFYSMTELTNTKIELTNTKSELTNTKSELTNTKIELTNTKSELTNTKSELTNTKTELTNTKTELSNMEGKLECMTPQNATLMKKNTATMLENSDLSMLPVIDMSALPSRSLSLTSKGGDSSGSITFTDASSGIVSDPMLSNFIVFEMMKRLEKLEARSSVNDRTCCGAAPNPGERRSFHVPASTMASENEALRVAVADILEVLRPGSGAESRPSAHAAAIAEGALTQLGASAHSDC
jgi:hypothetical protein